MAKRFDILSLGSIYLDINCLNYPFTDGLKVETETVGETYQYQAGGSAVISATVCASLGLKPVFVGKVGSDDFGRLVAELLAKQRIEPGLIVADQVQTNLGLNFVNPQGQTLMNAIGSANQSLQAEEILAAVDKYLGQIKYLYLGGYFKLKKLAPYYPELLDKAKSQGVKIILDHGRINNDVSESQIAALKEIIHQVDIYLPSEDEFLSVWQSSTIEEGLKLARHHTPALIAVKQSHKGATGIDGDGHISTASSFSVTPLNTVGAGDSFNAGFLTAQIKEMTFRDSLTFANATAAVKISLPTPPTYDQVCTLIAEQQK